jgi:hypothetical protein
MIFEKLDLETNNRFLITRAKTPSSTPSRSLNRRKLRQPIQNYKKKDYSFIEQSKITFSPQRKQLTSLWMPQNSLNSLKPFGLSSNRARYVRAYTPIEEFPEFQANNWQKQPGSKLFSIPRSLKKEEERVMKSRSKDIIAGW